MQAERVCARIFTHCDGCTARRRSSRLDEGRAMFASGRQLRELDWANGATGRGRGDAAAGLETVSSRRIQLRCARCSQADPQCVEECSLRASSKPDASLSLLPSQPLSDGRSQSVHLVGMPILFAHSFATSAARSTVLPRSTSASERSDPRSRLVSTRIMQICSRRWKITMSPTSSVPWEASSPDCSAAITRFVLLVDRLHRQAYLQPRTAGPRHHDPFRSLGLS